MKTLRLFIVLSALTGVLYPLLVTGIAQYLYPAQCEGSLVKQNGQVIGSYLVGQMFTSDQFVHGRPSACNYETIASGASNAAPTFKAWAESVQTRQKEWKNPVPDDLLTASGSGLDPDIFVESAHLQIDAIAQKKGWSDAQKEKTKAELRQLIQPSFLHGLSPERINVLSLNLAIEAINAPKS